MIMDKYQEDVKVLWHILQTPEEEQKRHNASLSLSLSDQALAMVRCDDDDGPVASAVHSPAAGGGEGEAPSADTVPARGDLP